MRFAMFNANVLTVHQMLDQSSIAGGIAFRTTKRTPTKGERNKILMGKKNMYIITITESRYSKI
jgi:hypothetical protein